MVRSKCSRHGRASGVCERDVAQANLARGHAIRRPAAGGQRAFRTHGSLEPQHGGNGSSRSVERPTESAERDHRHADGALHVYHRFPKTDAARDGGQWPVSRRQHVGADDQEHAPDHGTLAQTRGGVLKFVQASAPGDETVDRPAGKAEQAQFLAGGRIHRQPVRIVGVPLRAAHLFGIAVAPDRALAQKPVRGQPRAREQD